MSFVHLHVHSHYSLLTSTIRIPDLIARAKKEGMNAVALTDTGNLFGAIEFVLAAKAEGLRPILGAQLLFAPSELSLSIPQEGGNHRFRPTFHSLGVLCENYSGYQTLCRLMSESTYRSFNASRTAKLAKNAFTEPWGLVTEEILARNREGLFFITGGLRAEPSYLLLQGKEQLAKEWLIQAKAKFGDRLFLEIQDHGIPEEAVVNEALYAWGKELGIACVGTSAIHYLDAEDAEAHEVLQCIEYNRNLDVGRPRSLVPSEFRFRGSLEMEERLSRFEGAYQGAIDLAEKCQVEIPFQDAEGKAIVHLPRFRPEGVGKDQVFDLEGYLKTQAEEGLALRMKDPRFRGDPKVYHDRLKTELAMITRTGFSGYFLIVADFIQWAKRQGIPVGPGRGSGAGSLVAYALQVTDLDPIPLGLLFERFINPERVSLPDFDIDFCQERRGEVIQYVKSKYGEEMVSQIITYGKLQTKAVIKDVGRVFGFSFEETNAITSLVPDELNIKLDHAIETSRDLRAKMDSDPKVEKLIQTARKLEGLVRNLGMHAAGVIITDDPVTTYAPLYFTEDGDALVQFDKDASEKIGLVKFDFLGLKTLTVIDVAIRFIRETAEEGTKEKNFSLSDIGIEDVEVYRFLSSGDTDGVFQLESSGMKDLCTRLMPENLEDVTAINALFRPGPLGSGMVEDFIEAKHGRRQIRYELPALEPILRETYGVILYQEQVMRIARELAGYSLGQADLLRRAMGKKKPEEMAKQRESFVKGAAARGVPLVNSEAIFDLMAKFAEYGFNKSHSAAYGLLTLQTAYLKKHYPVEFMAALMTTEMSNTDKIAKYIANARARGVEVLTPDVNLSGRSFTVDRGKDGKKAVRFGLEAIKGVGGVAVDCILEARASKGPFKGVLDFSTRVPTRKANKKVLESLTLSGAFDSIAETHRAALFESLESILERATQEQEEEALGQSSLFDAFGSDSLSLSQPKSQLFKSIPEWPLPKKLAFEKQLVGFYVSGHPMESWQRIAETRLGFSIEKILEMKAPEAPSHQPPGQQQRKKVRVGGIFTELREATTKKGFKMGIARLEDLHGSIEVVFFPESYQRQSEALKSSMTLAEPVLLEADVDFRGEAIQLLANRIEPLTEAQFGKIQNIVVRLTPSQATVELLRAIKKQVMENRGNCPLILEFVEGDAKTRMELPQALRVAGTPAVIGSLSKLVGESAVRFQ